MKFELFMKIRTLTNKDFFRFTTQVVACIKHMRKNSDKGVYYRAKQAIILLINGKMPTIAIVGILAG